MSDEADITALVNSYARLLDGGDVDAVSNLFEHATWRSDASGAVRRGSAEIRPVYERLQLDAGSTRTKHLLTNLTVTVEPDAQTASSHCYWTVLQNGISSQPIDIILSGQYSDQFEKADGKWRFTDRLITVDLGAEPSAQTE